MNKIAIRLIQRENYKKRGTDFLHQECGITCTSGESIKVRCSIPKDELTIFYTDNTNIISTQQQFPFAMNA